MSDPQEVKREAVTAHTLRHLAACAEASEAGAVFGALAFLQDRSAGMPLVALMLETARSDARFWAETASPVELECFMLASADKLAENGSLFHGRQIKRLVAALWQRMSPDEKKAFLQWLQKGAKA